MLAWNRVKIVLFCSLSCWTKKHFLGEVVSCDQGQCTTLVTGIKKKKSGKIKHQKFTPFTFLWVSIKENFLEKSS